MKLLMGTSLVSTTPSLTPKRSETCRKREKGVTAPWAALAALPGTRAPSDVILSSSYEIASLLPPPSPPTAQYLFLLKCQF